MTESRHVEVERKYTVGPGTRLPDLVGTGPVAEVVARPPVELLAVYFDTAELDLLGARVTLRRRVGGADAGWHLKQPGGTDTRTELRLPLGRAVHTVPERLRDVVEPLTGGARLIPVATVATRRLEHVLTGPDGAALAVLCDDEVRAGRLLDPQLRQHWREWEVELEGGPRSLLQEVEGVLLRAGAAPAGVASKAGRALLVESPPRRPLPTRRDLRRRRTSTEAALCSYLAEHLDVLEVHREGLRGEAVHTVRVAARRLRSALTTYAPLFEPGAVDAVRDELRWLGQALADARDAEVMRAHLDARLDASPGVGTDALRCRVAVDLDARHRTARRAAGDAVASERFQHLLRSLEAVVQAPALTPEATAPAHEVLPRLLERDARRLRRAAKAARRADGVEHDLALHEVRKKAKRLRYAAESAAPVLGKPATRLAARAEAVQEALGEHQDAVTTRRWLEAVAGRADVDAATAFGAGRMHRLEELRATASTERYETAWRRLPHRRVDRWLRGPGR